MKMFNDDNALGVDPKECLLNTNFMRLSLEERGAYLLLRMIAGLDGGDVLANDAAINAHRLWVSSRKHDAVFDKLRKAGLIEDAGDDLVRIVSLDRAALGRVNGQGQAASIPDGEPDQVEDTDREG